MRKMFPFDDVIMFPRCFSNQQHRDTELPREPLGHTSLRPQSQQLVRGPRAHHSHGETGHAGPQQQ